MVAGEPVEVQFRVEFDDPGMNIRGLVIMGRAGGEKKEYSMLLTNTCVKP